MLAVILVGGIGKRLRPLTGDIPKPLLPLANRTFLHHQFDVLKAHGIREAVLCTSYRAADFQKSLGRGRSQGMRLAFAHEDAPLGTGGAIKNAEALLRGRGTFLALNGDVLMKLDISSFLKAHRRARAEATIALARVPDPTLYGLVKTARDGRVLEFLEKPSPDEIESDTINAGAYLFEPSVLAEMPSGEPYSLERRLFPDLVRAGRRVFGFAHKGYWNDIGTPERYLQTHLDLLGGRAPFSTSGRLVLNGGGGKALVGRGAKIAGGVSFRGGVCVGPRCRVGRDASLEDCVVLEGTRIKLGTRLRRCIVTPLGKTLALEPA